MPVADVPWSLADLYPQADLPGTTPNRKFWGLGKDRSRFYNAWSLYNLRALLRKGYEITNIKVGTGILRVTP